MTTDGPVAPLQITIAEARRIARKLLHAGYHHPTINCDVETGEVYVTTYNRAWCHRTVRTMSECHDLLA